MHSFGNTFDAANIKIFPEKHAKLEKTTVFYRSMFISDDFIRLVASGALNFWL